MEKEAAVASLGQSSLLLPAWIKAALHANDRLKLYLSVLQLAVQHAAQPSAPTHDWERDLTRVGLSNAHWLKEFTRGAYFQDQALVLPHLVQWLDAMRADLNTMARPLCDLPGTQDKELSNRKDAWLKRLDSWQEEEGLQAESIKALTHGNRQSGDSFHLLVMDLHKALNAMASEVSTEDIEGAHVWQIDQGDRELIRAFMRGLNRTAPLKFDHPGLATAITRDQSKLLIQNDIGTNDAHVLVIEVEGDTITLTYSDLHATRFRFFRRLLEELGYQWSVTEPQTHNDLNAGKPYWLGQAQFHARSQPVLLEALSATASRIVFVIDWNRARKRLQLFVRKPLAIELLEEAARTEVGHMAWLIAGGDRMIFEAMQSVDNEAFRIGDRLDQVLGEQATRQFLQALLRTASLALRAHQPASQVADEARMLLARALRQRSFEFDLLAEHAAYCHALALSLSDTLEQTDIQDADAASARAKGWELQADHLLTEARKRAERQKRWAPMLEVLDHMDDVADELEEASFVCSMARAASLPSMETSVASALQLLANTTLEAIQDQVKAIEIARQMIDGAESSDAEAFLQALWRMLKAERICDEMLRTARRAIVDSMAKQPVLYALTTELADHIENTTDHLLSAGYALRRIVFQRIGVPT